MRLHRNLVFATIDGLDQIFNEGAYADKMVTQLLKRDKRWGSRDRAFIAETVYDIVRWKRLYIFIAEIHEGKPSLNRTDLWRMFAVWATLKGITLPDWKQLEGTPTRRIKGRFDAALKERAIRESIPDWIDNLGTAALGEKTWETEIAALNQQADVILRVNKLKANKTKVHDLLLEDDIASDFLDNYPDAIILNERANVFKTQAFSNGMFEVQDASSQLVAPYLEVKPGMRVVDACAGAGGKTLHLAALMENKGQLIALDIYENKLKELKRRAKRAGAFNIETRAIQSTKIIKKLHNSADRVLIDAPCTGLGVLRRNPDAKWKLQPDFFKKITITQQEILQHYSKMLKIGGKMVYATCSILPQENREQVDTFLTSDAGSNFELVKDQNIRSAKSGYDGFYMALLERKS
ncbi:MAG: methyltransferase domain-containing protein [Flavobacteriaceae bacterium]|nr:methyltransferase domain-containing protein [Flavobacteriaceae bacterium]